MLRLNLYQAFFVLKIFELHNQLQKDMKFKKGAFVSNKNAKGLKS